MEERETNINLMEEQVNKLKEERDQEEEKLSMTKKFKSKLQTVEDELNSIIENLEGKEKMLTDMQEKDNNYEALLQQQF